MYRNKRLVTADCATMYTELRHDKLLEHIFQATEEAKEWIQVQEGTRQCKERMWGGDQCDVGIPAKYEEMDDAETPGSGLSRGCDRVAEVLGG